MYLQMIDFDLIRCIETNYWLY